MKKSIVLIGMPGAGKTTLGRMLAQRLDCPFVDTDQLLEQTHQRTLQQLLDEHGYLAMRELEAQTIIAATMPASAVIATGGSVVYRDDAMQHLLANGIAIYLAAQLATVVTRVKNFAQRGFNAAPGMSLAEVYRERLPLYQSYAQITIAVDGLTPEHGLEYLVRAHSETHVFGGH